MLETVDAVAGYTTYIDLIRPTIAGKQIVSTAMQKEVDRVSAALNLALSGTSCAVVSSGDPRVYAMAGLVLEMCREWAIAIGSDRSDEDGPRLVVEVVPGIPALCSDASLLEAPLTHDFAAIFLSDLLTPWETIEKVLRFKWLRVNLIYSTDFYIESAIILGLTLNTFLSMPIYDRTERGNQ